MSETTRRGRLLFDCTHVFRHPWSHAGIQRVVRNIVRELPSLYNDQECLPVAFLEGKLRKVERLLPDDEVSNRPLARWYAKAERRYGDLWEFHSSFDKESRHLRVRVMKRMVLSLCHACYPALLICKKLRDAAGLDPVEHRTRPLAVRGDDVLVLLDSSWLQSGFTAQVEKVRSKGLKVVAVIYDLIPLRYPQFCDEFLIGSFGNWFRWALANADAFVCISDAVRADVEEESGKSIGPLEASKKGYGFFHLGSELDLKGLGSAVPQPMPDIFAGPDPVCLAVGTIEPRKNHAYLLDAFESAWNQNSRAKLCIIGRWMTTP
jgi:glycosyltransferase involved in cell wall biosynthesis